MYSAFTHAVRMGKKNNMSKYLGIDTSNYTTSLAVYNSTENSMFQSKKLLPVNKGSLGLRQSDAVFHHTKQLPVLIEALNLSEISLNGIGVSTRPRLSGNSYMPCFLCGEGLARSLSAVTGLPVYTTSHQIGHILAALYSADKIEYIHDRFIAFHVSGGTTDCLICEPDSERVIKITQIGTSLDLKAGQAVDRVGVVLGIQFPCGKEIEKMALKSTEDYKIKPSIKGLNCSLSGIENKCIRMKENGESPENIAAFCLSYIYESIKAMTMAAIDAYGKMPVIYAGGVMSNSIIRQKILSQYEADFAQPEFSCDNASGVAIYAKIKREKI